MLVVPVAVAYSAVSSSISTFARCLTAVGLRLASGLTLFCTTLAG